MRIRHGKKIRFVGSSVSRAGSFSYESRLDRAFISRRVCVGQCEKYVTQLNARRRYDERRQVWKNSFLSRRVQVAHVGIKRITYAE